MIVSHSVKIVLNFQMWWKKKLETGRSDGEESENDSKFMFSYLYTRSFEVNMKVTCSEMETGRSWTWWAALTREHVRITRRDYPWINALCMCGGLMILFLPRPPTWLLFRSSGSPPFLSSQTHPLIFAFFFQFPPSFFLFYKKKS